MPRFGQFEVDFTTSEMRKNGVRVRIQAQPLRVLEILLGRPNELVTREELRDQLWPSDTFVDFERSLNAAVGKLRQCLNDSADRPLYIETIARKGYRFIAPIAEPRPEPLPAVDLPPPPEPDHAPKVRWALGAALATTSVFLWLAAGPLRHGEPEKRVIRLDLDVGNDVSQPAISRDGLTLVFIVDNHIAVRRLDDPTIMPLAGTEGASSPFFSPDGKWIGYFAEHKLRKVPVAGGESLTLCDAPVDQGGTGVDKRYIVAALTASGELSSVPVSGGTPRPFSTLEAESPEVTDHRRPVALPGGKGVLFVSATGIATGLLRVLPAGGTPAKTLMEGASKGTYLAAGYLLFARGGTVFAAPMDRERLQLTGPASPLIERVAYNHFRGAEFDASATGTVVYRTSPPPLHRIVVAVDSSGVKGRILSKAGAYSTPRLSPDGKRLAITFDSQIWIYDLAGETATRLTFGSEGQCCPVWTPDGEYVAFTSIFPGGSQMQSAVVWARWDGSGTVERLAAARNTSAVPFSFSRDGRWLTFHRNEPQTGYDLWATPVERTGRGLRLGEPRCLVRQAGLQTAPTVSPDNRWLAYGSDAETGRLEIYVIPFSPEGPPPERKWQVSSEGGRGPQWSPDGGKIFFRSPDDHLMVATVTAQGDSFQCEKPRAWFSQRLADVGPQPGFDVPQEGKRVIALIDAHGPQPEKTHLRVLFNAVEELRRRADRQQPE